MTTPTPPLVVYLMQANAGGLPGQTRPRTQVPDWPASPGHDGRAPAPLPAGMGLRKCRITGLWLACPVNRDIHFAE